MSKRKFKLNIKSAGSSVQVLLSQTEITRETRNTFANSLHTLYWYWVARITRVEDIRPAKSDRGEDDVSAEEEQVGDAEGAE